jgi:ssDNA-binding Zn-finger/Zn-ribbon topoisomerase 1
MNGNPGNQMCEDVPIVSPITGTEKRCSKCGKVKLLREFNQDKRLKSGKRSCCRDCANAAEAQRMSNPKYREKRVAQAKKNAKKPERRIKKYKSNKLWIQNNTLKVREYYKVKGKKRRSTPTGILNNRMGSDICRALSGQKKGRHWEILVGYTVEQLVKHLEKNFLPNMTWENRSEWHIDHKIPKSVFNYKTPEDIDFKKCWALKNLRPIWKEDNLKKWNHLSRPFQPSFSFTGGTNAENE